MKRVITYGTFDLLHYGHINLLKRAKALGDYLVVALSTDEFNWNEKQKKCYFTFEERKALLEAIRYVDLVIPEEGWEQKKTDVPDQQPIHCVGFCVCDLVGHTAFVPVAGWAAMVGHAHRAAACPLQRSAGKAPSGLGVLPVLPRASCRDLWNQFSSVI